MYKILSIDWDFFLNCPIELRMKFEQEVEDNEQWGKIYKKFKCLKNSTNIKKLDYDFIVKFINNQNCPEIYMSNDHGILYDLIDRKFNNYVDDEEENVELNITNIDFHHDCYTSILGNTPLNCASWLSCLYEENNFNINSLWIGHNNSYDFWEASYIDKYSTNIKNIKNSSYDIIFICKSKEYMPPHLDIDFIKMINKINKNKIYLEKGVLQNRWNRYKQKQSWNKLELEDETNGINN
jgi:hypothetical protein